MVAQTSSAAAVRNSLNPAETGSSVPPCFAGSGATLRGGTTETLTGTPPRQPMLVSRSARGDFEVATYFPGTTRPPSTLPVAVPSKKKSNIPASPAVSIRLVAL